jgi:hypothetical protein
MACQTSASTTPLEPDQHLVVPVAGGSISVSSRASGGSAGASFRLDLRTSGLPFRPQNSFGLLFDDLLTVAPA